MVSPVVLPKRPAAQAVHVAVVAPPVLYVPNGQTPHPDALPQPATQPVQGGLNQLTQPNQGSEAEVNPPIEVGNESAPELTVPEKEAAEATQASKVIKPQ